MGPAAHPPEKPTLYCMEGMLATTQKPGITSRWADLKLGILSDVPFTCQMEKNGLSHVITGQQPCLVPPAVEELQFTTRVVPGLTQ